MLNPNLSYRHVVLLNTYTVLSIFFFYFQCISEFISECFSVCISVFSIQITYYLTYICYSNSCHGDICSWTIIKKTTKGMESSVANLIRFVLFMCSANNFCCAEIFYFNLTNCYHIFLLSYIFRHILIDYRT